MESSPPSVDKMEYHHLRLLSLRENFSWTFVGNVVYAGSQWGILVLLAKLGSPQVVGKFTLGFAITAPVMIFSNLALRQTQATDAKHSYPFADYLALRLITTALAIVLIASIAISFGYEAQTALVIVLVGIAKAFESISDVFYGLLQRFERMDRIAISRMMRGIGSLMVLGLVIWGTGSIVLATASLAVVWLFVLVSYDVRSGRLLVESSAKTAGGQLNPRWNFRQLGNLAKLTLPLGFATMIISLNSNIPRYLIEHQLGESELGIFAAISYLLTAGGTIVSALGQAASPKLANYYAVGEHRQFIRLLMKLLAIGFLLGLGALVVALEAGEPILAIVYTPAYARHHDVFVWLVASGAVGFIASFLGYGITAARLFRIQPFLYGAFALSALGLCLLLIPRFGLLGAAMATFGAAVVQLVGTFGCSIYALKIAPHTSPLDTGSYDHNGKLSLHP